MINGTSFGPFRLRPLFEGLRVYDHQRKLLYFGIRTVALELLGEARGCPVFLAGSALPDLVGCATGVD